MNPPLIPKYDKPEQPGIAMNFDNTVSLYHIVQEGDSFDKAAQDIFNLIADGQKRFPDWPRVFYLDILGHLDERGRFDPDMVELQQEFLISALGKFLTAIDMPLVSIVNPEVQDNNVPDSLGIQIPDDGLPSPQ
ncbi:MAG: hypothetical protein AB8G77_05960 [Rhodothermales bacterium]